MDFRLNIPAKSAPSSAFSSPACSPRKLSYSDFSATAAPAQGHLAWSAPSIRSTDFMGASSPRTSPEKYAGIPDLSSFSSPLRSTVLIPRNTSAPPSPMHSKLHTDSNVSCFHPLPLPPSALSPMQAGFSNQSAPKAEMPSVAGQWQKGRLLGSGTFGCVYEATNRYGSIFSISLQLARHVNSELLKVVTAIYLQAHWSSLRNERSQHNS